MVPTKDDSGSETSAAQDELPGVIQAILRFDRYLGLFEQGVLAFLLFGLIALGFMQAIGRNLFSWSPAWSFELLRYSVFFIAMIGAALAAHTNQLIAMDVFTRLASPRNRLKIQITTGLFAVAMCLLLFKAGMQVRDILGQEGDYHYISSSNGALALPVGALLIGWHILVRTAVRMTHLVRGTLPPEEALKAH